MTPDPLHTDPFFVSMRRYNNDIRVLRQRYAQIDSCPKRVIAIALRVPESELDSWYRRVIEDLQTKMGVTE